MREKALAAYRAGFRALVFPVGNLKDVDDIPLDVRDRLELIAVETMDEVFACALSRVILPQNMNGEFVIEEPGGDEPEGGGQIGVEVDEV
jgi:ATP-dependent Lon protease